MVQSIFALEDDVLPEMVFRGQRDVHQGERPLNALHRLQKLLRTTEYAASFYLSLAYNLAYIVWVRWLAIVACYVGASIGLACPGALKTKQIEINLAYLLNECKHRHLVGLVVCI